MSNISPEAVLAALANVEGSAFERFFKDFGAAVFGFEFTPLGGVHDGGADGFAQDDIFTTTRKGSFYQASIQETYRSKLRQTIKRLRDYGRDPGSVIYFTSRIIGDIDQTCLELGNAFNVNITIYDGQWIASRINTNHASAQAYENHLRSYLSIRSPIGTNAGPLIAADFNASAAVFLAQETMGAQARADLDYTILSSLVLFALEEHAMNDEGCLTSKEVFDIVRNYFPKGFVYTHSDVEKVLTKLTIRDGVNPRQVVWDGRAPGYKLPFETRTAMAEDHARFETLIYKVREQARDIVVEFTEDKVSEEDCSSIVDLFVKCVENLYRIEGLKVATFLAQSDEVIAEFTISDIIMRALRDARTDPKLAPEYHAALMEVMRRLFYHSTPEQQEYLSYLTRTYSLMFCLKYDANVAKYFKDLKSNFRLVVGADVIIRALSESRLQPEDRATHAMLRLIRAANGELILNDYVVDEVYSHIFTSDKEFLANYSHNDSHITVEIARQIDKILIRAYYYAKIASTTKANSISSWGNYIEQFLPYTRLGSAEGKLALRSYLRDKFGMSLRVKDEIEEAIDRIARDRLTKRLMEKGIKDKKELAKNDSSNVYYIYALRDEGNEIARGSAVGYRTWWLTQETRIQREFKDLTRERGHAIIRPEVVVQLLAFAPNAAEIERSFGEVFPSVFGVRLGNRVNPSILKNLISRAARVSDSEPARMKAEMERLANRFKADEDAKLEQFVLDGVEAD